MCSYTITLITASSLYTLALIAVLKDLCTQWISRDKDALEQQRNGWKIRRIMYSVLTAAIIFRLLSLLVGCFQSDTPTAFNLLIQWTPALLYLSMYSLVVLFWAQLCHICWGYSSPWLRRIFLIYNSTLYIGFLVVALVESTNASEVTTLFPTLFCCYFGIGFIALVHYGRYVVLSFSENPIVDTEQTPLTPSAQASSHIVLSRIQIVTSLCGSTYLLGIAFSVFMIVRKGTLPYPGLGREDVMFGCIYLLTMEVVPTLVFLLLTRKTRARASIASP